MNAGPEGPAFVMLARWLGEAYYLLREKSRSIIPHPGDTSALPRLSGGRTTSAVRLAGDVGP